LFLKFIKGFIPLSLHITDSRGCGENGESYSIKQAYTLKLLDQILSPVKLYGRNYGQGTGCQKIEFDVGHWVHGKILMAKNMNKCRIYEPS